MKKISIVMIILSIIAKLFGFVREIVLSAFYQPGAITDSFLYSFSISGTIFSVIIAAFVTGFIPMFTRIEKEEGKESANEFMNNTQNMMLLIGLVISVFVFLFPNQVLGFLLPKASEEMLYYTVPFVRVTVFTIMFSSMIQLMTGYLHIRQSFIIPSLISIPLNIVLIGTIILSKSTSPFILPFGILISFALQAYIIVRSSKKLGFKFRFKINLKDRHLQSMIVLAIPLIIGSATSTIGGMVNQSLVSGISGGITYISQSQRIGGLIDGIFGVSIVSVMYPSLSKAVSENRMKDAANEFESSLVSLLVLIVPCAIGMILLSEPIIQFIYMRGKFTYENVLELDPVFKAFSYGLVGISLNALLVRVCYSFQDMKTPMYISIVAVVLQIILGTYLVSIIGLEGATLAMSITTIFQVFVLFIFVLKKFSDFNYRKFSSEIIKIVIASSMMGLTVYLSKSILFMNKSVFVILVGSIGLAIIVYFALLYILRLDALHTLLKSRKKNA